MEAIYNALAVGEDETTDNGFLKNAFHYQLHDRIQWGNMLCIVLAGVFTWLLRAQYSLDLRLCVICLTVASAAFLAGFSLLHNTKLFCAVGYCWRDGDTVVIQCGEREYRIASVKELIGGDTRFFFARCATLSIVTDRDIFEIFSIPLHTGELFEQSSVYPLCEFVLRGFPYLQSVELPGEKTKYHYVKIDK